MEQETAGQMLQSLGMDGKLWAEEMHKRFPAIAEDDLLGWCCNMIMAGYDEAQRRAMKREMVNLDDAAKAIHSNAEDYPKAMSLFSAKRFAQVCAKAWGLNYEGIEGGQS